MHSKFIIFCLKSSLVGRHFNRTVVHLLNFYIHPFTPVHPLTIILWTNVPMSCWFTKRGDTTFLKKFLDGLCLICCYEYRHNQDYRFFFLSFFFFVELMGHSPFSCLVLYKYLSLLFLDVKVRTYLEFLYLFLFTFLFLLNYSKYILGVLCWESL